MAAPLLQSAADPYFLSTLFMKPRSRLIIGWVAAVPVILMNLMATVFKFVPVEPGSEMEAMAMKLGTHGIEKYLGILEGIILLLFIIPRTSTVGFVLMTGYLGGALATIITHGGPLAEQLPLYVVFVFLAISGYFRNPELVSRLLKWPTVAPTQA